MRQILNIAHRGGAGLWPENTLFAFTSAAKAGFSGAELDVQLTRDGRLVVFHDFQLSPVLCRDSTGLWLSADRDLPRVRDLSLAELQSYDVGRPKPGSAYALNHPALCPCEGEHMPSLAQVIAAVMPFKDFHLYVELKSSTGDPSLSASPEALAEAVIADLRAHDFLARSTLVGFDWRALAQAKKIAPEIICWCTTKPNAGLTAADVQAAGGDGWFCAIENASAPAVASAHALGLSFAVWTVNETAGMQRLIAHGADALCTDRPDLLQPLL